LACDSPDIPASERAPEAFATFHVITLEMYKKVRFFAWAGSCNDFKQFFFSEAAPTGPAPRSADSPAPTAGGTSQASVATFQVGHMHGFPYHWGNGTLTLGPSTVSFVEGHDGPTEKGEKVDANHHFSVPLQKVSFVKYAFLSIILKVDGKNWEFVPSAGDPKVIGETLAKLKGQ
jgi:hypothetical protein